MPLSLILRRPRSGPLEGRGACSGGAKCHMRSPSVEDGASYRLKKDVRVDAAEAVSGLAGAGCAAGAGAGSSRFDERFEV